MPSGYTAAIQDGKLSFTQFALQCARAFGACIMQREEPTSSLPKLQEPSYYHLDRLKGITDERAKIEALTDDEVLAQMQAGVEEIEQYNAEQVEKTARIRGNYETMLAKAQAWAPPTEEHEGLKEFMVKQITESIDFDCRPYQQGVPPMMTPAQWKEQRLEQLDKDQQYHEENWEKEQERTNSRNKWIRDLYASLPVEDRIPVDDEQPETLHFGGPEGEGGY